MKPSRRLRPGTRRAERRTKIPASTPLRTVAGVRGSRVATAQARIAVDYYDRRDVRDRLVEALLRELAGR